MTTPRKGLSNFARNTRKKFFSVKNIRKTPKILGILAKFDKRFLNQSYLSQTLNNFHNTFKHFHNTFKPLSTFKDLLDHVLYGARMAGAGV